MLERLDRIRKKRSATQTSGQVQPQRCVVEALKELDLGSIPRRCIEVKGKRLRCVVGATTWAGTPWFCERTCEMVALTGQEIKGLSLSRKSREGIRVTVRGVEFFIYATECHEGRVKIVLDAPHEVLFLRAELIDEQEPQRAA